MVKCGKSWQVLVTFGQAWLHMVTSHQQACLRLGRKGKQIEKCPHPNNKKKASPPRSAISFSGIKTMSFWRLKDPEGKRPLADADDVSPRPHTAHLNLAQFYFNKTQVNLIDLHRRPLEELMDVIPFNIA